MKLILVRHGETAWAKEHRYQGSTDVPLNKRGLLQARLVAKRICQERPDVIFASQMRRSQETANAIRKRCRKKILIDKRLNELSFGNWEGKFHDEIAVQFPQESKNWHGPKWWGKPVGGESIRSLEKRTCSFLKFLAKNYPKADSCALIIHGGPIRMFILKILELPSKIFWRFRIDTASVTIIDLENQELILLNGQAHLNGLKPGGKK